MRICQIQNATISLLLVSFFVVTLNGCAKAPVVEKKGHRAIQANWNKLPLRFSHREGLDFNGVPANPFFDIDPNIKNFAEYEANNYNINYFVTTGEDSRYLYDLDLYSGKLYQERAFCPQSDIWDNYKADLIYPNFTQGIVPRVYDENKNPMKIVIISDRRFIEPFKHSPMYFDEARILGSVIVESCENYPCDVKTKWKATQILFGVSGRDPQYRALNSFTELKTKVDWSYAKGMLTNMHGYHKLGASVYPAYRISKELNLKDTYEYFNKTANVLNLEKLNDMNNWRVGCMKLYDSIWDESEKIRGMKSGQAEAFLKYFKTFYAKSSNEFYECQKLVRPGSISDNFKRVWFFSYLQSFTLLEKNGFYYSCVDNMWTYNPRVDETHFYVNQNKELERCRAKNFEKAFDQSINGMSLMKNQINRQYRFLEYDSVPGGSHQKIYGWLYDKGQNYACRGTSTTPVQTTFDVFPQDVVWENFKQDEDKVIR